jgi:lipopolysaccharide transport system ATP-binding protein
MDKITPAIFHITHWKAGSQWIRKILTDCVPGLIVTPMLNEIQFLEQPIQAGKVYPTVYVTKEQFDRVNPQLEWKRFIVIRDLRDTLVSAYFSIRFSHNANSEVMLTWRNILNTSNEEDGLIYLAKEWLPSSAAIQKSWLESGEPFLRYEDIIENDLEILEKRVLNECNLPVSPEIFRAAVTANRFERLAKGRKRGEENIFAHERKGTSGDWNNHFSDKVKEYFKAEYGQLLIDTGYAPNSSW